MKKYFKGFYMSFGMFCAIPLPVQIWDKASMALVLPYMPLVGLIMGSLWWFLAETAVFFKFPLLLASAGLSVFPFFITGFLHLDGYMDTSDAVLSRRGLEEKLRILKDPHTGAFAVIMLAVLFLLQFAAVYTVLESGKLLFLFISIFVISRCCSAFSILLLKPMAQSSYAKMFKENTKPSHKAFCVFLALGGLFLSYYFAGFHGLIVGFGVTLGYIGALAYAYKEFKGISGDLTGFSLVISELCGISALAAVQRW